MLDVELLDLRTLLLILGLVILTMSLALVSIALIDRNADAFHQKLLALFGLSLLLLGLAGLGLGLRGLLPDWISIYLANSLWLTGVTTQVGVFWYYHSKRMPWRIVLVVATLSIAVFNLTALDLAGFNAQHRTLMTSLFYFLAGMTAASIILRWHHQTPLSLCLAGINLLLGTLFLLRAGESWLSIEHQLLSPLIINQLTILATTLSIPILTLLFVLIIKENTDQALRWTSEHLRALEEIEQQRTHIQELLIKSSQHEMIAHMARGIAHDFNNLLSVISLDHDLLLERLHELPDQAELTSLCADIDSALRQAQAITAGLMSLGSDELAPIMPVEIQTVLADVDRIVSRALPERIAVNVSLDNGCLIGLTHPGFLTAALINLCWNARDAITDGGALSVNAKRLSAEALPAPAIGTHVNRPVIAILVEDTGQGIPADILPDLFKPTFSTKSNNRGHGLGLFMVAQFAKRTGAAICVESIPASGTRFIITIPTPETEAT